MDEREMARPAVPTELNVWRCWGCGRVIARIFLVRGCAVEIKCRCGVTNIAALDKGNTRQ